MLDLWFAQGWTSVGRRGGMLYVSRPDGVWAVLIADLTFPDELTEESDHLVGHLGALVHGMGHLLLGADIDVSPSLDRWATEPTVPMADLGAWVPGLMALDGMPRLCLVREFDDLRASACVWEGKYLVALTPTTEHVARLSSTAKVDAPPFGHDQHGP
jgi:hypothetical protein